MKEVINPNSTKRSRTITSDASRQYGCLPMPKARSFILVDNFGFFITISLLSRECEKFKVNTSNS